MIKMICTALFFLAIISKSYGFVPSFAGGALGLSALQHRPSTPLFGKSPHEEVKQVSVFPPLSMTGVSPVLLRICATISGQMYEAKNSSHFHRCNFGGEYVKPILFDNFGLLNATTPPILMALVPNKHALIVGWRGSTTTMDWAINFAFLPLASKSWIEIAPSVRAQGAYCSLVENFMCLYQDKLCELIDEHDIKQVIFTGHSLGGGVAQVAHLYMEGERKQGERKQKQGERKQRRIPQVSNCKFRLIALAAPMVVVDLQEDKNSTRFLDSVGSSIVNIIFASDPVPRLYANLKLLQDVVQNAIPAATRKIPFWLRFLLPLKKFLSKAVDSTNSGTKKLQDVASRFRHVGRIIHYEHPELEPKRYVDRGAYYEKPEGSQKAYFQDLPSYKKKDPKVFFDLISNEHNFLVSDSGLGLAYNNTRVG